MGLLDLFRKPTKSAGVAKERLRIIVAQERSNRGAPDYLPLLRREILEVIHRYVNIDPSALPVRRERPSSLAGLENPRRGLSPATR